MSRSSRALRVGVLLHGQLVEERLFADGLPITFGQSLRCKLSLPADGVPVEHVLFAIARASAGRGGDDRRYVLRATERMVVRVAHDGTVRSEHELGSAVDGVWS